MDFFRLFLLQIIIFSFSASSFGQIESGKVQKTPSKTENREKKKDETPKIKKPVNYHPATILYLGGTYGLSYRSLSESKSYFAKPLGERANETYQPTGSFSLGAKFKVKHDFFMEIGLSLAKNGEAYKYKSPLTDSSFQYKRIYTHFAVPIKLQYIRGEKFKLIAGVGLQPQIFINSKTENSWTNSNKGSSEETIKTNKGLNFFTVAALANLGIEWQFAGNASIYLLPEFRYQLNNSYTKQQPYIHKGLFYGVQLGLSIGLN